MFAATYVHDLSPFFIQFGETAGIRWYGLAYIAAFLAGYGVFKWLAVRGYSEVKPDQVGDLVAWWVVLGTIIGGRLGYMLFYDWNEFLRDPLLLFRVWEGGMSAHGGILGIVVATWLYARKYRVPWLDIEDNLVVTAPIGLFFGRCANFINGELYGRITSAPWAMKFPKELYAADPQVQREVIVGAAAMNPQWNHLVPIIENVRLSPELKEFVAQYLALRHPSQLYQAALEGVVLFAILWFLRRRCRFPNGTITGAFFIGYAVLRSIGEMFRQPDAELVGLLTRGQFLSIFLLLIGIAFVVAARMRPTYPPACRSAG